MEKDARERAEQITKNAEKYSEDLRANAKKHAQSDYEAAAARLEVEYQEKKQALESQYQHDSSLLLAKIKQEQDKLSDLEAKQFAYIQAKQREEEIAAQKDYYRLVIGEEELRDVEILRRVQGQIAKREAIDKVIYETYFRPAYNALVGRLFTNMTTDCGIYKITNLENGQAYIGQSVTLRDRFKQHIKTGLSSSNSTNKLYQQMKKYGVQNFTFEILEEVPRDKLNEREVYWIDFYKTRDLGLNGTRGNVNVT